jgi:CD109 antigen
MKKRWLIAVSLVLTLITLFTALPSCKPVYAATSYMAIIPKILASGMTQQLSIALLNGSNPAYGDVKVMLSKDGKEVASATKQINGQGIIDLDLPSLASGDYDIQVSGVGFQQQTSVKVDTADLVFLETDKPIYKPGQTIHISAISLNSDLRPFSQKINLEVLDAKGLKIFKQQVTADDYGMASLDLPLSDQPNLGVWKFTATGADGASTQIDVRVEEYTLPKYEVKVTLPKDWFLVSDKITGQVAGTYSFGKPVKGELTVVAKRYVGNWQEYTRLTKAIDGATDFTLPAVGYVAGTPASGGNGNVNLEFTITEAATGYTETTTQLLTVAQAPLNLQIIPDTMAFKPALPLSVLVLSQNPGGDPVKASVDLTVSYLDSDYKDAGKETKKVDTGIGGMASVSLTPPGKAVAMTIDASASNAWAEKILLASYSPSGNFIHVTMEGSPILAIGDTAKFKIYATKEATNFYYEVVARGRVVFSDYTQSLDVAFKVTPAMSPSAKLLVYQVLPNSEVAADYVPFDVTAVYPQNVSLTAGTSEAKPGDSVNVTIKTENQSHVILAAVDKSVFILAENRLNLAQVFDELERLYMDPQAELHEVTIYPSIVTKGAGDVFKDAGVIVLSNNDIPSGKEYKSPARGNGIGGIFFGGAEKAVDGMVPPQMAVPAPATGQSASNGADAAGLAQVERVRQFFPETWLYQVVTTDSSGKSTLKLTVPDSITTWMLRAVAISKEKGLGIAEAELKAFQPFFIKLDLPYSAIRGEEFPAKVAVYNYMDKAQAVTVTLGQAGWFDLTGSTQQTVQIAAGEVGSFSFKIKPKGLGFNDLKVTAQSTQMADAVIQPLLIEPEGVPREFVENLVLADGANKTLDTTIPLEAVTDSGRALLTITGSFLTQTLDGLESLIQMPFGCGEQNMINFAPDVFIARYLKESGQLKPEIMAKLEKMMITGYQRELTYRRTDGSFSAFGMQDTEGSLWLTAFVLKSFAQAKGLIYVDPAVLDEAAAWIKAHQKSDGSFDAVGFLHHQELLGGLTGKDALTAYVAITLMETGEKTAAAKAVGYLETKLAGMTDAYTLALTSYALEMGQSAKRNEANTALMKLAQEDANGLHWGDDVKPLQNTQTPAGKIAAPGMPGIMPGVNHSAVVETTAYAMLALIQRGDNLNAGRAGKWLTSQRNAYGGYASTQDTVVGLQALTAYANNQKSDVDLTVSVKGPGMDKQVRITGANFDVLQVVELSLGQSVTVTARGKGEVVAQLVRRYNIPKPDAVEPVIKIDVKYDATTVAVNDLVNVNVNLTFNPPEEVASGMLVVDISVPTGFAADPASLDALMKANPLFKRYDISGRKVIFYIDNLKAGAKMNFSFKVKALYPVKAKGVTSQAYSYYQPEYKGESLSTDITVN